MDESVHSHLGHSSHTGHDVHSIAHHHSHQMSGEAHNSSGHCGMSMEFHFGYSETILFSTWKISTVGGLIGSMFGIILMAALYEGLKYYREYMFWKTYNALQYKSVRFPADKATETSDGNKIVQPTMWNLMHCYQTFLHAIQLVLSYFLMLIFMTYNVWLCLAVTIGAVIGYFLFGWKKSVVVDVTEHCH